MPKIIIEEIEKEGNKYAALQLPKENLDENFKKWKDYYGNLGIYDQDRNALLMPLNSSFSERFSSESNTTGELFQEAVVRFSPYLFPEGTIINGADFIKATGHEIVNLSEEATQGLATGLKASGIKLWNSVAQDVEYQTEIADARMKWVNQNFGKENPYFVYLDPYGDGDSVIEKITPDKFKVYQEQLRIKATASFKRLMVPPVPASLTGQIFYTIGEVLPHIALAYLTKGSVCSGCVNAVGTFLTSEGNVSERLGMTMWSVVTHNVVHNFTHSLLPNVTGFGCKVVLANLMEGVAVHSAFDLAQHMLIPHKSVIGAYGFAASDDFCPFPSYFKEAKIAKNDKSVPSSSRVTSSLQSGCGGFFIPPPNSKKETKSGDKTTGFISLAGGAGVGITATIGVTAPVSVPVLIATGVFLVLAIPLCKVFESTAEFFTGVFGGVTKDDIKRHVDHTRRDIEGTYRATAGKSKGDKLPAKHGVEEFHKGKAILISPGVQHYCEGIEKERKYICELKDENEVLQRLPAFKKQLEEAINFVGEKEKSLADRHSKKTLPNDFAHQVRDRYYEPIKRSLQELLNQIVQIELNEERVIMRL